MAGFLCFSLTEALWLLMHVCLSRSESVNEAIGYNSYKVLQYLLVVQLVVNDRRSTETRHAARWTKNTSTGPNRSCPSCSPAIGRRHKSESASDTRPSR